MVPEPTTLSKPFWDAARNHKLVIQECNKCKNKQWFPRPWCIECGSRDLDWIQVSGRGNVYSFTIIRKVIRNLPAFQDDIPFLIGLIELEEGPRMYSNIVDCSLDEAEIGMKVEVIFEDITDAISLPKFRRSN